MAASKTTPKAVRLGELELDLKTGELRKNGIRVKLQEQPFQVLRVLIEHAGEAVTKEELQQRIWPSDTFVDFDHGLHSAITRLREALGDSSETPRYVETLPRRGYRFIAPVKVIGDSSEPELTEEKQVPPAKGRLRRLGGSLIAGLLGGALLLGIVLSLNLGGLRRWLQRESNPQIKSLAVLPLQNLSGDPAQEYLVDGMTDALITDLAQLGSVKVISRTSVMRYKKSDKPLPEIARELNVEGIVEGTVQRSGDRVRISAQLIYGPSDQHLWAKTYERDLKNVLALQEEVARAIVQEISLKVKQPKQFQATARTINPQAYDAYLTGLIYSRQVGMESKRTSLDYFNRAIQIDPQWAEPYAQLARSYQWMTSAGRDPEFYPKAKGAALSATQMDDSLADAHTTLAYVLHNYDWDWSGAEREYQRALELNPNYSEAHYEYAFLLMSSGRSNDAVTEIKRAEELDPLLPELRVDVGTILSCVGRHEEAIEQLKKNTEIDPNYDEAHSALGMAYLRKGMHAEAISSLETAFSMQKDSPDAVFEAVNLAYAYAAAGQKNKAREMLGELEKKEANGKKLELYPIYFALGEKDRALDWLEKAYKKKAEALLYLRCWPEFNGLREDRRFADLVHRVGLTQ